MEENERSCCCYRIFTFLLFCFLTLGHTSAESQQHLQSPRFTTQPSSFASIVSEGRTKILQCYAQGSPPPMYRWLKDGVPVGDFTTSQYYKIHNTRREDAGSYQCLAKNDFGTIFSEKIDVIVAYMGIFEDLTERRISVQSGNAVVLNLAPIESVPQPSVTWQTEEGPLNYDIKYAETTENQLIILSAEEEDQRAYRARAINTQLGKEENSAFIHVNVTGDPYAEVPPEIIVHPVSVKVTRGQQIVKLQCIANARPLYQLETLWLKDGLPLEAAGVTFNLDDPWNRTLALLNANLTYTGQYSCQVRLKSGEYPTIISTATITVQEPPSFGSPFRSETVGEYGIRMELPCDVIGVPAPYVTWFRNAEALDMSTDRYSVREDNALVIKKLTMDDSAMFQCLASNEAGEKSAYTWLKVKKTNISGLWRDKRLAQPRIIRVRASTTLSSKEREFLYDKRPSTPILEQAPENARS